ncbi:hypothetical protein EDB85DRAFT_1988616 [Lactarius pseudohatsudake]|nr:hypothetical protein EDB85DRAFT_1988616 [Lactarius pseudohatsudake]
MPLDCRTISSLFLHLLPPSNSICLLHFRPCSPCHVSVSVTPTLIPSHFLWSAPNIPPYVLTLNFIYSRSFNLQELISATSHSLVVEVS